MLVEGTGVCVCVSCKAKCTAPEGQLRPWTAREHVWPVLPPAEPISRVSIPGTIGGAERETLETCTS